MVNINTFFKHISLLRPGKYPKYVSFFFSYFEVESGGGSVKLSKRGNFFPLFLTHHLQKFQKWHFCETTATARCFAMFIMVFI